MTGTKRFLSRMALFLVAVAAVVGVLFAGIQNAFMANPALNGLIIAVLFLGIVYAVRQVQHELVRGELEVRRHAGHGQGDVGLHGRRRIQEGRSHVRARLVSHAQCLAVDGRDAQPPRFEPDVHDGRGWALSAVVLV